MGLVRTSLAGLVLTGVLAIMPAAAFAHGGGGHGGGGGGHGFAGGYASGGFTGRGVSRGSSGTRGFFADRGDYRGFDHRAFRGRDHDHDFHRHHFRDFDGGFVDFGLADFGYPDYPYYDPYAYSNENGYLNVERAVQEELAQLGYYHGPVDGAIGRETERAIRVFQSVAKIPVTGRIDAATLKALQIS